MMISSSFFNKPLSLAVIEEMLIQIQYDIVYHDAFETKRNLIRENKERFILVSIHNWMKSNNCNNIVVEFVGNIHLMLHLKEFDFHLFDIDRDILTTVKFTMA